jgi:hypothetical protein
MHQPRYSLSSCANSAALLARHALAVPAWLACLARPSLRVRHAHPLSCRILGRSVQPSAVYKCTPLRLNITLFILCMVSVFRYCLLHGVEPQLFSLRNYLLQDERRQNHTTKMEAASAFVATASTGTDGFKQSGTPAPTPAPSLSLTPPKNNSCKRRKQTGGSSGSSSTPVAASTKNSQPTPTGGAPHNPWTGFVQARPMMH